MGQKTRAEIDELILSWREDPAWELEETEGFEEHRTELLGVRRQLEAEWKARADKEHAAAVAELIRPAMAILPAQMQHTAQTIGTDLHLVLHMCAEMILPIKQQIDRLDARQDSAERELDRQIDNLRKQIEAAR